MLLTETNTIPKRESILTLQSKDFSDNQYNDIKGNNSNNSFMQFNLIENEIMKILINELVINNQDSLISPFLE